MTPSEGPQLAHFKCVACKTRQHGAARPADGVGDLCPGCGSLLEPVREPAEVFGFRHITSRENAGDCGPQDRHQRIADRVEDFFARRFSPEAVAAAMALPQAKEHP